MRRRILTQVLALLAVQAICGLGSAPARADRGGYIIRRFDVDLTVETNSDIVVVERLQVDFSEARHGIYRTIPIRYTDPKGYSYSLGFRLLEVTDDSGRSFGTKVSNEGRYTKIRIGDADRTVRGRVSYVIRYRVRDALGHFPEYDEIYWNATGHEWNTAIQRATATVHLPAELAEDSIEAAGYTGKFGSRERAVTISNRAPGVVRFESTGGFDPLEGLTVAVAWPHGHVKFPGAAERTGRFVADNWIVTLPFFWLGFLWRRYRRLGRDPDDQAPVMVQYKPPPGVTPGGVGTLIDETVDLRDITATVVDLAVRGYLTIRVEQRELLFGLIKKDETVFSRNVEVSDGDLVPHEERVRDALFESGDAVDTGDLKNKFYKRIPGIQEALYDRLVSAGYFETSPKKVRTRYALLGLLAGLVTAALSIGWLFLRGAVFPIAMILPLVVGVLTCVLFASFASAMPRKTVAGVRAKQWALGFQEFAQRVEADRLERTATDRFQGIDRRRAFESLLPYAMALQVAGEWAEKFEGIYDTETPGWFVGQHAGRGFSTGSFEESLSSAMSRASQTMAASPRSSSGSGGGGSSGGGGGGGGGGSW
jgi:uncharacterized membrane protein YgcG